MDNHDDVFLRSLIIGIISYFWEKVNITQVRDNKITNINVPFFYSMVGEEQFLTDFFTQNIKNYQHLKVEGNTEKVPRGIIKMNTSGKSSDELSQRYTRSIYNKTSNNKYGQTVEQYSSKVEHIPITSSFTAKVITSSEIQRFKIFEKILKSLQKVDLFNIRYMGFNAISVMIGFPDDIDISKAFEFNYPDNESKPILEFPFETLTFLPDVDYSTEFHINNNIKNFEINNNKSTP